MGAKNHAVVLPDANVDATLNSLVAAGFGAAGQRCMALSTAVFVKGSESWYSSFFLIVPFLFPFIILCDSLWVLPSCCLLTYCIFYVICDM